MRLVENFGIVQAVTPVDFQTAANNGDYVSLKNYAHVTVIVHTSIGTAGDDPVVTLDQAKTVAGGSTKSLLIDEIYHKTGATALSAVGTFTRVTQTAADGYDTATIDGAENEQILIIEVDAAELDTTNDFDCMRVSIADVGGNAQLGSALYILSDPRHNAIEAIAD